MQIIAINEHSLKARRQSHPHGGLATARYAHHDNLRRGIKAMQ
jgi:hypothetical protein